jgi:TPR repeat protein
LRHRRPNTVLTEQACASRCAWDRRRGYANPVNEVIRLYNSSLDYLGDGGHPIDEAHAFKLNAQAAALGYPDAILAMGWFYVGGRGVERDIPLAQHWYRRSARTGDPRAMFSLGQISYDASGYSDARRWFERATKQGHIRSYYLARQARLAWPRCSSRPLRCLRTISPGCTRP